MAPAELLDDEVAPGHDLTNMDGVVTSNFIVGDALVLTLVRVRVEVVFLHVHLDGLELGVSRGSQRVFLVACLRLILLLVSLLALLFLATLLL